MSEMQRFGQKTCLFSPSLPPLPSLTFHDPHNMAGGKVQIFLLCGHFWIGLDLQINQVLMANEILSSKVKKTREG
jgi:hypothetical protein